jgi:hypothetical protein
MVFANHINCYGLARLFIVTGMVLSDHNPNSVPSRLNLLIYGTVRPKGNMYKWYVETIFLVKLEAEENIVFQNYVLAVYDK